MKTKIAIVLFNLGGPDCLESTRPFLYNLFSDSRIISLPKGLRHIIAWFISKKRELKAQNIYKQIGGSSPLLLNTKKQGVVLEQYCSSLRQDIEFKTFIAMRYWHPFVTEVIKEIDEWKPDKIVLLPLYPQYSRTTTGSSLEEWRTHYKGSATIYTQCCHPTDTLFIKAYQDLLKQSLLKLPLSTPYRILFSAHGLPEKVIRLGDPYQYQVECSTHEIMKEFPDIDYKICYQSRVGPLKWIAPSTEEEIKRAGQEGIAIVIVPISFVSDHSETLVELDQDYAKLANLERVPYYIRVPTLGEHPLYIESLANTVLKYLEEPQNTLRISCNHQRICKTEHRMCPFGSKNDTPLS